MSNGHFKPVQTQIRFPEVENEVLSFWKEENIFYKSLENTKDNNQFVFYDGPPFATGLPHYGHLLAGTLKDIIPRYWTMRGCYVERRFGWDCHGLPIENEMEKEFNVSGKRDIEKLGLHLFNEACRSIVLRYTGQWQSVVERMGRWVDFNNQYRTMDASYMESIWWAFKRVWEKGLIYEGFRVQPYCPRCTTPLSNFELNEGYKDARSPSITVTFPLVDDPDTKILVWTTTPWTLPSNVVLVVGDDISYVKVKDGNNFYILAKERFSSYYHSESPDKVIVEEFKGSALVGKRYVPLFEYFAGRSDKFFQIASAAFVSTEDGTGIVHIAPAFGEDDFQVGQKLNLPVVCPVDAEGKFTEEVPDWKDKLVFDADHDIIQALKNMGRLVRRATIDHRYPYCYRCDTPLIYKSIDTWFMKIEPLKANMLRNNRRIHWVPDHLRDGRFGKGIESAPDWNISRNRYWGTPIPVWICADCGHKECVGSLDELHQLIGGGNKQKGKQHHTDAVKAVRSVIKKEAREKFRGFGIDAQWADKVAATDIQESDIHRHIIDDIPVVCPKCKSLSMKRTPEVLDCWFESGSMPYAQSHYPFENQTVFEQNFPADFIAEGLDQTRGWFYTLTVLASALFEKEAFKNVIVNGIILAEDGKKLSKRLKNYTPPQEILEKLGADALRLFLINSPAVKADDLRFSEKGVTEMARAILLPFWNAYAFFVTYANVDGWKPGSAYALSSTHELDQWIISLLNHVIDSVNREMREYNLFRVVPLLVDFIDNLTNWYIRRSRRRFWKSENDVDKNSAYETLYFVLVEFSKIMAPFLPFLTDALYRNLVASVSGRAPASIHLTRYPTADPALVMPDLETRMALIRQVVAMGRVLRSRYTIKNRQPLSALTIVIKDDRKRSLIEDMSLFVKEELNVKSVVFDSNEHALVQVSAKPNFRHLGKIYGSKMKEAARIVEAFTADDITALEKGQTRDILGHSITFGDLDVRRVKREGIEVETQGEITVALDTEITPGLLAEGHAREFINRIQNMRKEGNLNVTDRIAIMCVCEAVLQEALITYKDFICAETLGTEITWQHGSSFRNPQRVDVNGYQAEIAIAVVR